MWDCVSHILLWALCSNEPKFSTLSWVKIYTYVCVYIYVDIYTHLLCSFATELSKTMFLMQNHNINGTLSKACDLFGRKDWTFWIYSEIPKLGGLEGIRGLVALQTLYTAVQMKTPNTWGLSLKNHHILCTPQRSFSQYCTPVFLRPINYVPKQCNYNLSHILWLNTSAEFLVYFNCL